MKKIATTLGAVSIAGLALAPLASADDPVVTPPVTAGPHTFNYGQGDFPITIAYDCGPNCFTFNDSHVATAPPAHDVYRFNGTAWVDAANGISTTDGISFVNPFGHTATLTP